MSLGTIESAKLRLKQLKMPGMASALEEVISSAEHQGWSYGQFVNTLCEYEVEQRRNRKLERLIRQSQLPDGKTLATLDEKLFSFQIRRTLAGLLEGNFVERADNVLAFGLPGRGKTHFLAAVARELIFSHQYSVLFTPTYRLVQRLLRAKVNNTLDRELRKLEKIDIVIIDDIGYVEHSREEMEVFFTFLAERYERKSLMISSNLTFSHWGKIFKNEMTAMAAVDRLVHHSVILEFNGESIRSRMASKRTRIIAKCKSKDEPEDGKQMGVSEMIENKTEEIYRKSESETGATNNKNEAEETSVMS